MPVTKPVPKPKLALVRLTQVQGDVYLVQPFTIPPGSPDQGLPSVPGLPDNSLPGEQPGIDNELPVPPTGEYPDQGLPGVPTQPLPPGPDNSLPVPPGIWPPPPPQQGFILAYIPGHGWKYVKLGNRPDQGLPPGMPGVPTHPIAPGGPVAAPKPA